METTTLYLVIATVAVALTFDAINGFHDAANAIATLVASRAARPLPAILMASIANLLGPFLLGAAVALGRQAGGLRFD